MHAFAMLVTAASLLCFGAIVFAAAPSGRQVLGGGYWSHITLTGDANSYVTGGVPLTPAIFGFANSIDFVLPFAQAPAAAAVDPQWIPPAVVGTGGNLRLVVSSTGAEVANAGSTAGVIIDLYAYGR